MHTYRPRAFPPWMVVPHIAVLAFAAIVGDPFLLLVVLSLIAGAWIGSRLGVGGKGLTISAEGLEVWGTSIPWSGISRLERRHPLLGEYRLELREPITYRPAVSLWKTRAIWLGVYERPLEIGADIARWAPHLLPEAALSEA